MPITEIVFYGFSLVLVAAAVAVISVRNPIYSALFLVLAFFSAAAIWMLLEVEFLALILILVYVGAVMVLFLFVVMMLDINLAPLQEGFVRYLPVGVVVGVLMAVELLVVIWSKGRFDQNAFPLPPPHPDGYSFPLPPPHPDGYSNTRAVGELLFTNYLLAFEAAGVILLVAIIAAIALTHRKRTGVKRQNPSMQVRVHKDERVRLVKMDPEPRQE